MISRIRRRAWHEWIRLRGELQKWGAFLSTWRGLRADEFILYNASGWHFGWDYRDRQKVYVAALRPAAVVYIDLNSPAMTRFAYRILRQPGQAHVSPLGTKAFERSKVDQLFRARSKFPEDSGRYRAEMSESLGGTSVPAHAEVATAVLRSRACKGLVISQEGLDDWPWALMAAESRVAVFEPEGPLGSTCRTRFSLQADVVRIRSVGSQWLSDATRRQETYSALHHRTQGNYEYSAIARYMIAETHQPRSAGFAHNGSDGLGGDRGSANSLWAQSDVAAVFFLHALGDAANAQRYAYLDEEPLDYFEMTLAVLEAFEHQQVPLSVKPHPLSHIYRGDSSALAAIERLIASSRFLAWESSQTYMADLANRKAPVAISGRGSVLAEAAFCGVPAVALIDCAYVRLGIAQLVDHVPSLPRISQEVAKSGIADVEAARESAMLFEGFLRSLEKTQFFQMSEYNRVSVRNHDVWEFTHLEQ